jgi:hypothetical protein
VRTSPEYPGFNYHGEDGTVTYDFMPRQFITYRVEYGYRHSDVPYWVGRGGSTPPGGATNASVGNPADFTCSNRSSSVDSGIGFTPIPGETYTQQYAANIKAANSVCETNFGMFVWQRDMRRDEQKITFAILVKW